MQDKIYWRVYAAICLTWLALSVTATISIFAFNAAHEDIDVIITITLLVGQSLPCVFIADRVAGHMAYGHERKSRNKT